MWFGVLRRDHVQHARPRGLGVAVTAPNTPRTSVSGSDRSAGYAAPFLGIGDLPYFQTGRCTIIILIRELFGHPLLGHAHISITADVYAHVRLRLQGEAVDRMNDALGDHPEP